MILLYCYGYRLRVASQRGGGGGGYITSVARGHITTASAAASEDVLETPRAYIILYYYLSTAQRKYITVVSADLDRFSGRRTEYYASIVLYYIKHCIM